MEPLNVIIYGCGVMGRGAARALLEKKSFRIVGAVDIDPGLVGKDLGDILEPRSRTGITITDDADALFADTDARAVVLTTTSHLKTVFPQVRQCVKAGLNVISTCEELSFPWRRNPELAGRIDALAKENSVTVTGTGINPGYLMDTLPLVLTAPLLRVDSIKVTRMMNSAKRRIPFQVKVGAGMTVAEFDEKIENKVITGHVGLLESMDMIAAGLGWELDKTEELPPQPVTAKKETQTGPGTVKPGDVIGLISTAYGVKDGKRVITLEFNAYAGIEEEYDEIVIEGVPPLREKIIGGVHGDTGTVAMTVNAIPRVVEAPAGLKVMTDLPLVRVTP
jgi:4-hydroxy-tetrahydrodipicolinate reductase